MKIGVALNEVLRGYINQLEYVYTKYIGPVNIKEGDVTNFNLIEFFKFENINQMNRFMYMEAPLEIFGHADQLSDGLMNQFNNFIVEMKDEGLHQLEVVSREVDKSIPATFFFLSKTNCRIDDVRFVSAYEEKWNGVDVLITANPKTLQSKPTGKISIKVKASYNKDIPDDYEIESILDFIKDKELRDKILSTKITTYEEIKTN